MTTDIAAPEHGDVDHVRVALLGGHGILFDRWTKKVAHSLAGGDADDVGGSQRLSRDRTPAYLLSAMALLVVAIVYVMVKKPSPF